jgi:outer membrane protein OmpA-like peptidoglycan-associated protein
MTRISNSALSNAFEKLRAVVNAWRKSGKIMQQWFNNVLHRTLSQYWHVWSRGFKDQQISHLKAKLRIQTTSISKEELLQQEIDLRVGRSCPAIRLDLHEMEIFFTNEGINFLPGSSSLTSEAEAVCGQLCHLVRIMEEIFQEHGHDPLHLRIEGHVHLTKNVERSRHTSLLRATAVVAKMVSVGVSPVLLHPVGLGASSVQIGDPDENRRVVIILMSAMEIIQWLRDHDSQEHCSLRDHAPTGMSTGAFSNSSPTSHSSSPRHQRKRGRPRNRKKHSGTLMQTA